jgi:hypothetical protein
MADTRRPKDKLQPLPIQRKTLPQMARPIPPDREEEEASTLGTTLRMDPRGDPRIEPVTLPPSAPFAEVSPKPPRTASSPPRAAGKSVELFVIDETQLPGGERKAWRAAEIWTKRRVYGLDSTFKCVEILDRETGRPDTAHDMLGARLGGGRLREKDTVRFSYPLPLPGMEAMFVKGKKHGYTSPIERMIVRIRVLHTSAEEAAPTWDEIASRWSEPPPA